MFEFSGSDIGTTPTPARDRMYSRHMTHNHVINEECEAKPSRQTSSQQKQQSSANPRSTDKSENCTSLLPQLKASSKRVLPNNPPGGRILSKPTMREQTNNFTRGISAVDRSRPNLTSGFAKNYVRSTEQFFWNAMEGIRT
jgi:hypothetical protein